MKDQNSINYEKIDCKVYKKYGNRKYELQDID